MELFEVYKYYGIDENKPEIIYNLGDVNDYVKITDLVMIFYCYEIGIINLETAKIRGNIYIKNNNLNEAEQLTFNKYLK